jgi:exonuclease VII large subunit
VQYYQERQARLGEQLRSNSLTAVGDRELWLLRVFGEITRISEGRMNTAANFLDQRTAALRMAALNQLLEFERTIANLEKTFAGIDPRPWIQQGWTQLFHGTQQVKTLSSLSVGAQIHARLSDGSVEMQVTALSPLRKGDL